MFIAWIWWPQPFLKNIFLKPEIGYIFVKLIKTLRSFYSDLCWNQKLNRSCPIQLFTKSNNELQIKFLKALWIIRLFWIIRMSHWRHTMVDGSKFWISYQRPRLLRKASRWQLIQNLAPSTLSMWNPNTKDNKKNSSDCLKKIFRHNLEFVVGCDEQL